MNLYRFENLTEKVFRLQLMFFETLLYAFPFHLLSAVDGLYLIGWRLIFRSVALVSLTIDRLKNFNKLVKYSFGLSQIVLLLMDSVLGIIYLLVS